MAAESALIFLRALSQGRAVASVTLIAGPQAFLREYVLDSVRRTLANSGFSYRALQIGAGDGYGSLVNELEADDLFATRRFVAARILRSYRGRGGDDESPTDGLGSSADSAGEASLITALGRLGAHLRLALIYERDSAPAKVRRAVEGFGAIVNCLRPFENQIAQYAEVFARFLDVKLTRQAADLLAARHIGDLGAIANALGKAAINQPKDGKIDSAELAEPGPSRVPELFEIAESLTGGNPGRTLALFDRAIQIGRDPIEVLLLELVPQFRRMLIAAALLARKKSPAEVATAMGVAPSSPLVARSIEGARRFGLNRLERTHRRACELDASFKMGLVKNRDQAVAAMILELAGGS
jgi:DNA polymerase III delta subunit